MDKEPSHVKQLSLIYVCKIGLVSYGIYSYNMYGTQFLSTLPNWPIVFFVVIPIAYATE